VLLSKNDTNTIMRQDFYGENKNISVPSYK
jgi:hypothetical protein